MYHNNTELAHSLHVDTAVERGWEGGHGAHTLAGLAET